MTKEDLKRYSLIIDRKNTIEELDEYLLHTSNNVLIEPETRCAIYGMLALRATQITKEDSDNENK